MSKQQALLSIGNIKERPGSIVRGEIELVAMPTGGFEKVPVVIASGRGSGPTVLITANIHGNEVVGTLVCHRFLEALDPARLAGKVVVIPSLNPSGLRALTRFSELQAADPNRKWPSALPSKNTNEVDTLDPLARFTAMEHAPGPQERAWKKLFEIFTSIEPQYHLDLHSFTALSVPFAFFDRVFYRPGEQGKAEALSNKTFKMLEAVGFSVFCEASFKNLLQTDMYRTTASAVLQNLGIPSGTIELGVTNQADPTNLQAAVTGLFNLMKSLQMWPGNVEPLKDVAIYKPKQMHRVLQYPYATASGIWDPQIKAGEHFKAQQVLTVCRTLTGEKVTEIKADFNGYLIGWRNGIAHHEGASLAWVAVEDGMPMVGPWP